jgi:hypothetical protein
VPIGLVLALAHRQDLAVDLDLLDQEVARRAAAWTAAGASWELTHGDPTPKPAAWVRVETPDAEGDLILWVSGEAETSWVRPISGGEVRNEHHEIDSEAALRDCLDDFEDHLGIRT